MRRSMKLGDLEPPFNPKIRKTRGGAPINFAAVESIKVNARQGGAALFTNRDADGDSDGNVVMAWQAGDTATLGPIELEIVVEWTTGREQTFPSKGYFIVTIEEEL